MIETNTFAHLTHNLYHIIIKVLYFSTANDDAALYMPVMCYVIRSICILSLLLFTGHTQ